MKINLKILAMTAIASFALYSCGGDDEESCQNDDSICTVDVTVCCTEGSDNCKYQVGDNEYDNIEDALEDSECSASNKAPVDGKSRIAEQFRALVVKAKANL
ncbi:hypothetical protein SAMN04488029_0307 [Reichenbachiella faecimaris]|uniref:Uncharacterized protein n=1 Tax=Reichenbachiella faecimaris TaxID=692418 RepID=A0A1W2G5L5_REIFA|nr:hypothetical protein [Reichenbachiella faecimaris]SMD31969.1 hypothetical protein SAMN04488029_0307 [Reichenbachiella faecimaris]